MQYYEFLVQTGYGKRSYDTEYVFNNINDARNFYNSLTSKAVTFKKRFVSFDGKVLAREGYDIKDYFNAL